MKYSVISKFQGVYLGSFLGNLLFENSEYTEHSQNSNLIVEDIINNLDDDLTIWEKYCYHSSTITDITISLLPWIVFYHDNWHQLQHLITNISQKNHLPSEDRELIEVWIEEIVLALREKLDITNPLLQITNSRKLQHSSNLEQLHLIQTALLQGQSSKQLLETLSTLTNDASRLELLLSLYLFLSIPDDFPLTIKRVIAVSQKFRNLVSLTGALAGAYNSLDGIPCHWLNSTQNNAKIIEGLTIIKKLGIFWSGMYQYDLDNFSFPVIAIPQTLQLRYNLKIISQEEYRGY